MPTLSQLQYALAVEKHRHFGKASRSCAVSQPTLSQQLRKLEDEVGIILFDRMKKPILPTPEGKLFLEQARAVLREHRKLLHVSKQAQEGEIAGDFRLAVIPTVSSDLIPRFIQPFSKANPKVELSIEELKTATILSELRNDKLDGAILATPLEGTSDLKVHPMYYEPFYVYLSPGHPLLRKSHLAPEDLDAAEMWLLEDGHCFKSQVLSFCSFPSRRDAALTNIRFQSGSLDTLKRLVRTHRGFTLIPALMALSLDRRDFATHVRPFKAPVPVREVSFVYRRDHWKLGIVRAIQEAVLESLPDGISRRPLKNQMVIELC